MFGFYLRYAAKHLLRERQRTLFVLFCIAAGVAAIVALRTLSQMMRDALTGDLQASNRGDLAVRMPMAVSAELVATLRDGSEVPIQATWFDIHGDDINLGGAQTIALSQAGEARLLEWVNQNGFDVQPLWSNVGPFTPMHRTGDSAHAEYAALYGVIPEAYPYYGQVIVLAPSGATLAEVLAGPRAIALTPELAESLGVGLGDTVTLAGAEGDYEVTGLVDPKSEASLVEPLSAVFPFGYLAYDTARAAFDAPATAYYLRGAPATDLAAAKQDLSHHLPGLSLTTTEDLRNTYAAFSGALERLVTGVGLVSLLIGGLGIANTMLVVVSRRAPEIAVLKTLGVGAGGILALFVTEALLLGLVGGGLGVVLGQGLVPALQPAGERFVTAPLRWRFYPEAAGLGFALGLVVALAFSILPIVAALSVRPNSVLHPQAAVVPRAGRLASALTVAALAAWLGWLVGPLVGDSGLGMLIAYGVLLALGLASLALNGLLWLVSGLPSFGSVSIKLAQRALRGQRSRAASTLLAMSVGIGGLSLLWLLVQGTLNLVNVSAERALGGDIFITVESVAAGQAMAEAVAPLPGVSAIAHDDKYQASIVAINGDADLAARRASAVEAYQTANPGADGQAVIERYLDAFSVMPLQADTLPYAIASGADLAPNGQDEIVLGTQYGDRGIHYWLGLAPGDSLTLRFASGAERSVTVRGLAAPRTVGGAIMVLLVAFRETDGTVSPNVIPRGEPAIASPYALTVAEAQVNPVMDVLAAQPGIFMIATRQLNAYTERFVDQFVPLPLTAMGLALFASVVIMANAVSLATLERRRQIGVMKALGVQAEAVLGLLLLENGIVGLLGGLIGAGLSALLIVGTNAIGEAGATLPYGALLGLVGLAVLLALGATTLAAWSATREKPLNVLRYE
jgi:ABC-type antimicrobial peptide transport system permease subunit